MKLNPDGKTVRAMDLLAPGIGEIIGGSQREENLELLQKRIEEEGMRLEDYEFYLDLRKFGTFPHSGYGLGFERILMYITGMTNIRDVIPFPRTPKNADY
jgi:asparaginyl-tRNA synthetase